MGRAEAVQQQDLRRPVGSVAAVGEELLARVGLRSHDRGATEADPRRHPRLRLGMSCRQPAGEDDRVRAGECERDEQPRNGPARHVVRGDVREEDVHPAVVGDPGAEQHVGEHGVDVPDQDGDQLQACRRALERQPGQVAEGCHREADEEVRGPVEAGLMPAVAREQQQLGAGENGELHQQTGQVQRSVGHRPRAFGDGAHRTASAISPISSP
jgi:hypothetical protein